MGVVLAHGVDLTLIFELFSRTDVQIVLFHLEGLVVLLGPDDLLALQCANSLDLDPVIEEVLVEGSCLVAHEI